MSEFSEELKEEIVTMAFEDACILEALFFLVYEVIGDKFTESRQDAMIMLIHKIYEDDEDV